MVERLFSFFQIKTINFASILSTEWNTFMVSAFRYLDFAQCYLYYVKILCILFPISIVLNHTKYIDVGEDGKANCAWIFIAHYSPTSEQGQNENSWQYNRRHTHKKHHFNSETWAITAKWFSFTSLVPANMPKTKITLQRNRVWS